MKYIPNGVTRAVAHNILLARKHSPRVMFVAGIAGVVTSTVLACKATLKLEETLNDVEFKINEVKGLKGTKSNYPQNEYTRDLATMYIQGGLRVTKLYAPAVALGTLSIASLTGSHVTLTRRNASLTAAYAAISKGFDEYRDRVKEALGEDKERDIYQNATLEADPDDPKSKKTMRVFDENGMSPYARLFDEYTPNWKKNAELNRLFVTCQQNYMNHLLHARGHVFLNDAYDALGFERSTAGAVVGWVLGKGGDNYIDFGLSRDSAAEFNRGWERSVFLDFNVDGVVYDLI